MTPEEVTAVIKRRLARHPDFTALSVHTQLALGGRFNVCTIIVAGDYRKRSRVIDLVEEGIRAAWISNTRSGAVVITLPVDWNLR